MTAAVVLVLADEHPVRDMWVDEQARQTPGGVVPIGDDTYQGVGFAPYPDAPLVHLFALPEDMPFILSHGFTVVPPCPQ